MEQVCVLAVCRSTLELLRLVATFYGLDSDSFISAPDFATITRIYWLQSKAKAYLHGIILILQCPRTSGKLFAYKLMYASLNMTVF